MLGDWTDRVSDPRAVCPDACVSALCLSDRVILENVPELRWSVAELKIHATERKCQAINTMIERRTFASLTDFSADWTLISRPAFFPYWKVEAF